MAGLKYGRTCRNLRRDLPGAFRWMDVDEYVMGQAAMGRQQPTTFMTVEKTEPFRTTDEVSRKTSRSCSWIPSILGSPRSASWRFSDGETRRKLLRQIPRRPVSATTASSSRRSRFGKASTFSFLSADREKQLRTSSPPRRTYVSAPGSGRSRRDDASRRWHEDDEASDRIGRARLDRLHGEARGDVLQTAPPRSGACRMRRRRRRRRTTTRKHDSRPRPPYDRDPSPPALPRPRPRSCSSHSGRMICAFDRIRKL